MVMKLKITVNGDEFSYEGEATFTELGPLLDRWFAVQTQANQAALDAINSRVRTMKDALGEAVDGART